MRAGRSSAPSLDDHWLDSAGGTVAARRPRGGEAAPARHRAYKLAYSGLDSDADFDFYVEMSSFRRRGPPPKGRGSFIPSTSRGSFNPRDVLRLAARLERG